VERKQCLQVVAEATDYWVGRPGSDRRHMCPHCWYHWSCLQTGITQK